jgi:hypothetical protein
VHRAVFVTGVMAYVSAPLWGLFLILSTVLLAAYADRSAVFHGTAPALPDLAGMASGEGPGAGLGHRHHPVPAQDPGCAAVAVKGAHAASAARWHCW